MNILLKNITYLDESFNTRTGDICISGNRIAAAGEMPEGFVADRIIDGTSRLAMPGLVNCHTHSYMSVFRNLADDLTFDEWLFKSIMPREDMLTPEDAYHGAMLTFAEMLHSGTTCFMDMHMFPKMTIAAADKLGLRGVMSRGLVGSSRNDEGGIRRLNEQLDEAEAYKDNGRFSFRLGPHAIYTCGEDYLRFLVEKAHELNMEFHIHLSETENEVENCMKEHSCSPVEYLDSMGFFGVKTAAAHCVHLSEKDMDILAERGVSVIHNPKSNMKLANGFAPVPKLMEKGVNVCMGTDSQASNNTVNMFSDMTAAALIHKGVTGIPTAASAREVLKMATVNGAKALGFDDLGLIKEGYLADIAILDLDRPQFFPRNDLAAALVYSANGSEVDTVIIDGQVVMEHGVILGADEKEIFLLAQAVIDRIK
ncbi:MAG: amidohydrolase [Huintestinicola sp.]